MSKARKAPMTLAELQAMVVKWQKRLRLMDWDVEVTFDDDKVCENQDSWAMCFCTEFLRYARIYFVHPDLIDDPEFDRDVDFEVLVVHELLHIFWSFYEHGDHAGLVAEEQTVDTISTLLVHLERYGETVGRAPISPLPSNRPSIASRGRNSVKKERYLTKGKHGNRTVRIS